MAAPHIPNLLDTLRSAKASRSRRAAEQSTQTAITKDEIVQQTDDDAAGSRLSAVEAGYLDDPFARPFSNLQCSVRRMPIINRGTYVRTTAIDMLVDRFLAAHADKPVQIVSLGAGTDTRFFRLLRKRPELAERLVYHELDFAATTVKKITAIERTPTALALLEGTRGQQSSAEAPAVRVSEDKTTLASACYHVHAVDLRGLAPALPGASPAATAPPSLLSLSSETPTLLLAECCLTYLDPPTSTSLLTHFTQTLIPAPTPLAIILYEPLHPHDAFGRTMRANLASRGIALPGLEAVPTLAAHAERLRGVGFVDEARGCEVGRVWGEWIGAGEKERLRRVEGLDEEEEWVLLAGHYGVVWGARGMVLGSESEAVV